MGSSALIGMRSIKDYLGVQDKMLGRFKDLGIPIARVSGTYVSDKVLLDDFFRDVVEKNLPRKRSPEEEGRVAGQGIE